MKRIEVICDLCGSLASDGYNATWHGLRHAYVGGVITDTRHDVADDICAACMDELSRARAAIIHRRYPPTGGGEK